MNFEVGNTNIGNDLPLNIIAGPCQLESSEHSLMIAKFMADACSKVGAGYIFKGSFDKANRTSISGKRGVGLSEGLKIMEKVKASVGCPVLTDVHDASQCSEVASIVDILQIPAFLCRQTDLLIAAAKTNAAINVKKGQFLAPWEMPNVAEKLASTGNKRIMLCERGTSFGYNTLVTDMRGIPEMLKTGYPIIMDATHSVQQPGGQGRSSGGQREFAPLMARLATSIGISGVFIETHENPDEAPSDGPNMIKLNQMPNILENLMKFDQLAKQNPFRLNGQN
jgi:2-dehydro-3-deoxyphosphooctonate aldolase (KDO 8-P synthase)